MPAKFAAPRARRPRPWNVELYETVCLHGQTQSPVAARPVCACAGDGDDPQFAQIAASYRELAGERSELLASARLLPGSDAKPSTTSNPDDPRVARQFPQREAAQGVECGQSAPAIAEKNLAAINNHPPA